MALFRFLPLTFGRLASDPCLRELFDVAWLLPFFVAASELFTRLRVSLFGVADSAFAASALLFPPWFGFWLSAPPSFSPHSAFLSLP